MEILIRRINQSDLAAMAGVARENTNRILSEWKRSGLVTKSSDSYWIADKARLEGETYGGHECSKGDNYSVAPGQRPHSFGLSQ